MQYLNKNTYKRKSFFSKWLLLFIILLFLVFLSFRIKPLFVFISKPFIKTGLEVSEVSKDFINRNLNSRKDLMNEINSLKKQNEEMVLHIASLEQKLVSYISFEEHFNFNKENIKLFIPAQVVSKPNQSAYDTIIVSKGASDNISIDAPVYTSENSVIGFVDSFLNESSIVRLFSTPGLSTNARLERTGSDILVIGKGGGNMIAEVPKDTETTLGDKILLPSYSNKIIGIIKDISIDDRSVYKKLYITLPVNIFNLDYVYIKN